MRPREKDRPPVVPDPDVPSPDGTTPSGQSGTKTIVDQMSHADGSDQGVHQSGAQQPVGYTEKTRNNKVGNEVE